MALTWLCLFATVSAQSPAPFGNTLVDSWQQRSPAGGDIVDVAFSPTDPGLMLAAHVDTSSASNGALLRSVDAGASWVIVAELAAKPVYSVKFAANGRAFVGTLDGIYTAANASKQWTPLPLGIGLNDAVLDIAMDADQPAVIWAGIADAQGSQTVNLLRSADAGRSWSNRTPPLPVAMGCRKILIDPFDPKRVIAVFGGDFSGGQVWVTEDAGSSWALRSSGLPNRPLRAAAFDGSRLYVGGGLRLGQQDFGLYVSEDLGRSWRALHQGNWPLLAVASIAIAAHDQNLLLVGTEGTGLHRSSDGGRSWQLSVAGTEGLSLRAVRFRPRASNEVAIASLGRAVLSSQDSGIHFIERSSGILALNVRVVAIDPFNDDRLALANTSLNSGGVYQSSDDGKHWLREALPATRYNDVAFAADGGLYAVSAGPSTVAAEGLYRRERDGSWRALGPDQGNLYETDIKALRLGRHNPALIVMGGGDRGSAGSEATLWRSQDRGDHWKKIYESSSAGTVGDVELIEIAGATRLLASFEDGSGARHGRVLRSEDAGDTWVDASTGLPSTLSQIRLCASESRADVAYLAGTMDNWRSRLFRSGDGGRSWVAVGSEGSAIIDLACDPASSSTIYVSRSNDAGNGRRIERSIDGGASFSDFTAGAAGLQQPAMLAINLAAEGGSKLFLGTTRGSFVAHVRN